MKARYAGGVTYLLVIVCLLLMRISSSLGVYAALGADPDAMFTCVVQILCFGALPLVGWFAFAHGMRIDKLPALADDFSLKKPSLRNLLLTLALAIPAVAVTSAVSTAWTRILYVIGYDFPSSDPVAQTAFPLRRNFLRGNEARNHAFQRGHVDFRRIDRQIVGIGLPPLFSVKVIAEPGPLAVAFPDTGQRLIPGAAPQLCNPFRPDRGRRDEAETEALGHAVKKDSLIQTCYECGVPIFCPAFSDCSAGFGIGKHQWEHPDKHVSIDSVKDFVELTQIKIKAGTTGLFMVGGGTPKNFAQDTVVCAEILGFDVPMHKYAIQITVADVRDGACSSSTLKEACSWGKVDVTYEQMVYAEGTTVIPAIASYVYHNGPWKEREYKNWNKLFQK